MGGTGAYISNCFWDAQIQTTGTTESVGGNPDDLFDVRACTTAQMQDPNTFLTAGWDFLSTWDICEGTNYPKLTWQVPVLGDFGCPDGVDMFDFGHFSLNDVLLI